MSKIDTTSSFYVFFPEKCKPGKVYGAIQEKTNIPGCQNVYITSSRPEDGLEELGSFNSGVENQDNRRFWIDLKSRGCDVYVEKLMFENCDVLSERITLFVFDGSIFESEILTQNGEIKSSECLVHLFRFLKPTNNETAAKTFPYACQDSYWHLSKVIQQINQRQHQLKIWRQSKSKLQSSNIICIFLLDLILGFFMLQFFHHIGGAPHTLEILISSIKVVTIPPNH